MFSNFFSQFLKLFFFPSSLNKQVPRGQLLAEDLNQTSRQHHPQEIMASPMVEQPQQPPFRSLHQTVDWQPTDPALLATTNQL